MKKLSIIANWKSHKTIKEAEEWLHAFHDAFSSQKHSLPEKTVIIASAFTLFEHLRYCTGNLKLPIQFAAQDISPFGEGAYTGEVNGRQLRELTNDVLIGHSERRKYFSEDDTVVNEKVKQALANDIRPIVCVSDLDQVRSIGKTTNIMVAYEPLLAIGSGNADTRENANDMAKKIKKVLADTHVLYGGSVTSKNVHDFTSMTHIDGVLVGNASLNPQEFFQIVINA